MYIFTSAVKRPDEVQLGTRNSNGCVERVPCECDVVHVLMYKYKSWSCSSLRAASSVLCVQLVYDATSDVYVY